MKRIPKFYYHGKMTQGKVVHVYSWDRENFQIDIVYPDSTCNCIKSFTDLNHAIDYAQNLI